MTRACRLWGGGWGAAAQRWSHYGIKKKSHCLIFPFQKREKMDVEDLYFIKHSSFIRVVCFNSRLLLLRKRLIFRMPIIELSSVYATGVINNF